MGIRKNNFVMFQVSDGWIVYNTSKQFKEGHTHLRNRKSALAAIDFVSKEKIPSKCSNYYLISLLRLSNNPKYIERISQLMAVREMKGPKEPLYKAQKSYAGRG